MKLSIRIKQELLIITSIIGLFACSNTSIPEEIIQPKQGDYSFLKETMTSYINKQMKDKEIVGLSIAVIDDQDIVWQQGFGYANFKEKIKATPETRYRAGSISKLFTAMAAMKLVEEGKMSIDRPLVEYLPEFSINSRFGSTDEITPRTIMTHHSGLPGDMLNGMFVMQPEPFTNIVHNIKDEYTAYAPNTIFAYSNLGVNLLGHTVENVSDQSFEDYVDKVLLEPLGMSHSKFEHAIEGSASSKSYEDNNKEITEFPIRDIPAGGLNTTVTDLSRLAMMVHGQGKIDNKEVLSAKTLNSMLTVQHESLPFDFGNEIGLAWFADKTLGEEEQVWGHSGGTIAHRTNFSIAPKSKLSVVVLANTASANSDEISEKLLQLAWQIKTGRKLPKIKDSITDSFNKSTNIEGTYATLLGKVDISKQSGRLYKISTSHGGFNAYPIDDTPEFILKYRLLGLIPIQEKNLKGMQFYIANIEGHDLIVVKSKNHIFPFGIKVRSQVINKLWKKRLGKYTSADKDLKETSPFFTWNSFELKLEDGFLLATVTTQKGEPFTYVLTIVNDEELLIEGMGRSFRETIKIINNGSDDEQLSYQGYRFKK